MRYVALLCAALFVLAACGGQNSNQPEVASSAEQGSYAAEYPKQVERLNRRADEGMLSVQATTAEMVEYPGVLDEDVDWALILQIMEGADEAGRSHAVVESMRRNRMISDFLDDHRKDIVRRVDREVEQRAEKQGVVADFNAWGAVDSSLENAVDKEMEEALRKHNEAHRLIRLHEDELGRSNVKALEQQVDTITFTSFVVYVDLVDASNELDDRISEAKDVKKTLDDGIAEREAAMEAEETTKDQKEIYQDEIEAMESAREEVDETLTRSKEIKQRLDKQKDELQKQYETAFDELTKSIEDKANEQAQAAEGEGEG